MTPPNDRPALPNIVAPIAWGCLAAAFGAATARLDPNVLEEGIIVHAAERMLHGEHLYRDIIVHTSPLPYELLAAAFRLFGPHLEVARALLVAFHSAAAAAVFAMARRAGGGALAHVAAALIAVAPVFLFPQLSNYYYTTIAFYGTLVAVYAAVRAVDSSVWAVAAGAGIAVIALCKQTTGVAFAVPLFAVIVSAAAAGSRTRRGIDLVTGGMGVAVVTLSIYALRGDLAALVFGIVELPLSMGSTYRAPVLNLWPPGELSAAVRENWAMYFPSLYYLRFGLFAEVGRPITILTQLLYALPFVALGFCLVRALRGGLTLAAKLHMAVLIAMTLNLFPRSSWGHLVVALPPALIQLALLIPRSDRPTPSGRLLPAAAAASAAAITVAAVATAAWIDSRSGPPTFGERVALRPVSEAYKQPAMPRVIQYLRARTRPGDAIFVARQEPLLYFATSTRNPTPFGGVLPGLRELQEPRILEALEDVRYVVMSDIDQPLYTYYSDELPGVQAHLERHFRIPRDFSIDDYSWIVVVERGPDRGATAIDLLDERANGRAWLRDRDDQIRDDVAVPQRLAARQLHRPLPVALGAHGGGIDFPLDVPGNAVFQAGFGFRGLVSVDHQYFHPAGVELQVAVDRGEGFETLWSARVDDGLRAGRRWTPVEIDLGAYAHQRVVLRLEARAGDIRGPDRLTWWGSPRIALRAGR